jgi:hypothetical protein
MTQVFQYPYEYIYRCVCVCAKMYITVALRGIRKKERKNDRADNPRPWAHRPAQVQSHELMLEACTSHRRFKMRPAPIKIS